MFCIFSLFFLLSFLSLSISHLFSLSLSIDIYIYIYISIYLSIHIYKSSSFFQVMENNELNRLKLQMIKHKKDRSKLTVLRPVPWGLPGSLRLRNIIIDLQPVEVARAITAMNWSIFSKLKPEEFMEVRWQSPNKNALSPNLCRLATLSDHLSNWITLRLLSLFKANKKVLYTCRVC